MRKSKNYTDDFGKKQGYWEIYYANGTLKSQCNYQDNFLIGVYKLFDKEGKLTRFALYKPNLSEDEIKQISSKNNSDRIHDFLGIKVIEYAVDRYGETEFNFYAEDISYLSKLKDGKFVQKSQNFSNMSEYDYIGFYYNNVWGNESFGYYDNNSNKTGYWKDFSWIEGEQTIEEVFYL